MLENGLIDVGPVIPEDQPVFHFESAKDANSGSSDHAFR